MRRAFFIFSIFASAVYVFLMLALGSSPVQRWVLAEITDALAKFDFDLKIESIEFSVFSPKLYLNRVQLSTRKKAVVKLKDPLLIDKIKIQFKPLNLIYREIFIEELVLFHPQIILPAADEFYLRFKKIISSNRKLVVKGQNAFSLVLKKIGVVDALFDVQSGDPQFAVRSWSLSVFLKQSSQGQQTIVLQSNNLEFDRGSLKLSLTEADIDVDITKNSFRVNKAIVVGNQASVDLKGTASLPLSTKGWPENFHATYKISLPLNLMDKVSELGLPSLMGKVESSGTVSLQSGAFSGGGTLDYMNLLLDGYGIGRGKLNYLLEGKELNLSKLDLEYGEGQITSRSLKVELSDHFPVAGTLDIKGLTLTGLLNSIKSPVSPVRMNIDGRVDVSGTFLEPFEIKGKLKSTFQNLVILNDTQAPVSEENTIFNFSDGAVEGEIGFTDQRFSFAADVNALEGSGKTKGYIGYDNTVELKAKLDGISFSKLGRISTLKVGGRTNLVAEVSVIGSDAKVAGMFDFESAEIARIDLGKVRGQVYYQNLLLSFENLMVPSLSPIKGSGFVDFRGSDIHYRFDVDVKRSPVNQIVSIFKNVDLGFSTPGGGGASARISIEGGHDERGIEVVASGKAKATRWYSELWNTTNFIFTYRPDNVELNQITLLKDSGSLDVRGHFTKDKARLVFRSNEMHLAELDFIKGTSLNAIIGGEITLEGNEKGFLSGGYGEATLKKTVFRGKVFPDSKLRLKPESGGIEFLGNILGNSARGRYLRRQDKSENDELMVYFKNFDLLPLLTMLLSQDIQTIDSIVATGDLSFRGRPTDWKSLSGTGLISELEIGLKDNPLKNSDPVFVNFEKGKFSVTAFNLVGIDGEIAGEFNFLGSESVNAKIDGSLDLKYLQPFVSILDYGSGKVNMSVRISGPSDHYKMLGNLSVENGMFRLKNLKDEFKAVQVQASISQDQIYLDRFESNVNGGSLKVGGNIHIDRFGRFSPNLTLLANRIELAFGDYLHTKFSGEFSLKGDKLPYLLEGKCDLIEGKLTRLEGGLGGEEVSEKEPALMFNILCDAQKGFFVATDVMNAEFGGEISLRGNSNAVGLLGRADSIRGSILFRKTRFELESASVRFESLDQITPRFKVAGFSMVKEQKTLVPQEYQVNLQVLGTPDDYKIKLSSSPALKEGDIISLLVLGVTSQGQEDEGDYVQFGTAIVGQIPLQSKIQDELGLDIKVKTQESKQPGTSQQTVSPGMGIPSVQIEKDITSKTKVSFTNTLETVPARELRIEQILDENLTVNATAGMGVPGSSEEELRQSYGVDFRYRFHFE